MFDASGKVRLFGIEVMCNLLATGCLFPAHLCCLSQLTINTLERILRCNKTDLIAKTIVTCLSTETGIARVRVALAIANAAWLDCSTLEAVLSAGAMQILVPFLGVRPGESGPESGELGSLAELGRAQALRFVCGVLSSPVETGAFSFFFYFTLCRSHAPFSTSTSSIASHCLRSPHIVVCLLAILFRRAKTGAGALVPVRTVCRWYLAREGRCFSAVLVTRFVRRAHLARSCSQ
jgi:hypothetical protein